MKRFFRKRLPEIGFILGTQQKKHLADKLMDTANGVLITVGVSGYLLDQRVSQTLAITTLFTYALLVWCTLWL